MEAIVKIQIGNIKFEVKGSSEVVERERDYFSNVLFPKVTEALPITEHLEKPEMLLELNQRSKNNKNKQERLNIDDDERTATEDFSRTNLNSYLKRFGSVSDQDFIILAAYFNEKKNGLKSFSSTEARDFFSEARRTKPLNISDTLLKLAKKGLIMDDPDSEKKNPKQYIISSAGLEYIESYQPKEGKAERKKSERPGKSQKVISPEYSGLCADDFNIQNYPAIKDLDGFKQKMILTMHIVTKEGKGTRFTANDVNYLLTDVLGIPATIPQIRGVFNNHKDWFKVEPDENNKGANRRMLLTGAKEFAESLIAEQQA